MLALYTPALDDPTGYNMYDAVSAMRTFGAGLPDYTDEQLMIIIQQRNFLVYKTALGDDGEIPYYFSYTKFTMEELTTLAERLTAGGIAMNVPNLLFILRAELNYLQQVYFTKDEDILLVSSDAA